MRRIPVAAHVRKLLDLAGHLCELRRNGKLRTQRVQLIQVAVQGGL